MKKIIFSVCGLWLGLFICVDAQEVLTSFSGPGWNDLDQLPAGWTSHSMGGDYANYDGEGGGAGSFRTAGAMLTLSFHGTPGALIYWPRHNTSTPNHTPWVDTGSEFDVLESVDGVQWTLLHRFDGTNIIGASAGTSPPVTNMLNAASRYVRFIYSTRPTGGGNVGIDGVVIEGTKSFEIDLAPNQSFIVNQGAPVTITATPFNEVGDVTYVWSCVPSLPKLSEEGGTVVWDTTHADVDEAYTVTCSAEDEETSTHIRSVSFTMNQAATLPAFFSGSGWTTDLPVGWEQVNMGADYATTYDGGNGKPGSFRETGASLSIFFSGEPTTLSYYLRRVGGSAWTGTSSMFDVEESVDGNQWTVVRRFDATNPLDTSGPAFTDDLNPASRYVRFKYTTKASGNVGIDGVRVSKALFRIALDLEDDRVVEEGDVIQITAIPTNAASTVSYTWSNSVSGDTRSGETLNWNTTGCEAGDYILTCMAHDGEIFATNSVKITVRVPAKLPTAFSGSGWANSLPVGWEQNGMGSDYNVTYDAEGMAGQFDSAGDSLEIFYTGVPTTVSYWLRFAVLSGTWADQGNVFEVQESADGVDWSVLQRFDSTHLLPNTATNYCVVPAADSRFIRFLYITKTGGNVGIDGVCINGFQNFGVRLDPAIASVVAQGETMGVEATPFHAAGEVEYVWTCEPVPAVWQVEENRVLMDLEEPGTYTVSCVADDGEATMTNQVAFTVLAPPAPELPPAPAELPTFFSGSGWKKADALPTGWTQTGMGNDYTQTATESGNYDKLDGYAGSFRASGASLTIHYATTANKVAYWLQHNHGGSAWAKTTNAFNVLESTDGTHWTTLRAFNTGASIPGRAAKFVSVPQADSRYIRFEYATKSGGGGNVGIDGVHIAYEENPPEPLRIALTPEHAFALPFGAATSIVAAVSGGTGPYTHFWETDLCTNALAAADLACDTLAFCAAAAEGGAFYALLTVTDADGISEVKEVRFSTLAETIAEPLDVQLAPSETFALPYGASTAIVSSVSGGTEPYTYAWATDLPEAALADADLTSPTLAFTAADPAGGSYTATLVVTDVLGESVTNAVAFTTLAEPEPEPPPTSDVLITSFQYDSASGEVTLQVVVDFMFDRLTIVTAHQLENGDWKCYGVKTNTYTASRDWVNVPISLSFEPNPAEALHIIGVFANDAHPAD